MSATLASEQTGTAFLLAAALEAYELDVAAMVTPAFNPEACSRVSRHMDQMRLYASALPPVSVAWVEVLIRHFELTHALWNHERRTSEWDTVVALHENLQSAVEALRRQCLRQIARSDSQPRAA